MIIEERMRGSIDQIEGLLRFETGKLRTALTRDIAIYVFFVHVH